MKIKQHKETVKQFLTDYPFTRDNHKKLQNMIWVDELEELGLTADEVSATYFMRMLENKKLSNPASIGRVRQKLQEQFPELRGAMWYKKQQAENETIHEVRTFNEPIMKQVENTLVDKNKQVNLF